LMCVLCCNNQFAVFLCFRYVHSIVLIKLFRVSTHRTAWWLRFVNVWCTGNQLWSSFTIYGMSLFFVKHLSWITILCKFTPEICNTCYLRWISLLYVQYSVLFVPLCFYFSSIIHLCLVLFHAAWTTKYILWFRFEV